MRSLLLLPLLLTAGTLAASPLPLESDLEVSYTGPLSFRRGGVNRRDIDEFQTQIRFVLTPVAPLGNWRLGAEWERFSFGNTSGAAVPNSVQALNLVLGFDARIGDSVLLRFEVQPGLYGTSLRGDLDRSLSVPVALGGTYLVNDDLQLIAGLSFDPLRNYPVLPVAGIRWKFAPNWALNAVPPAPRIEYQFSRFFTLHVGANLQGRSVRVDRHFGDDRGDRRLNGAALSYSVVRAGAGFDWKVSDAVKFDFEAGAAVYRQFDFHRVGVRRTADAPAPYVSLSVSGSF